MFGVLHIYTGTPDEHHPIEVVSLFMWPASESRGEIIASFPPGFCGTIQPRWRLWSIASRLVWSLCWVHLLTSENAVTCTAAMTTSALMSFIWRVIICFRECCELSDSLMFVMPKALKGRGLSKGLWSFWCWFLSWNVPDFLLPESCSL